MTLKRHCKLLTAKRDLLKEKLNLLKTPNKDQEALTFLKGINELIEQIDNELMFYCVKCGASLEVDPLKLLPELDKCSLCYKQYRSKLH